MAASDVQIAKMALQHIGDRYDIASLSEASVEAEQINLLYDNVRDALLREHPWKFALRYTSPSELAGTPPAHWDAMYTYPGDALRVWRIVNPLDPKGSNLPPLEFTVARNSSGTKVLLTNESDPEFEYTEAVTNSGLFDTAFDMALSWRLAQHVARPLTGDDAVVDRVQREAQYWVELAKREDANEGIGKEQSHDPDWIRLRN